MRPLLFLLRASPSPHKANIFNTQPLAPPQKKNNPTRSMAQPPAHLPKALITTRGGGAGSGGGAGPGAGGGRSSPDFSTIPNGRFERVRLLGRGSFGTVTLVKDMWNGERFVAMKRISTSVPERYES